LIPCRWQVAGVVVGERLVVDVGLEHGPTVVTFGAEGDADGEGLAAVVAVDDERFEVDHRNGWVISRPQRVQAGG
jgi:hypothetical protein